MDSQVSVLLIEYDNPVQVGVATTEEVVELKVPKVSGHLGPLNARIWILTARSLTLK